MQVPSGGEIFEDDFRAKATQQIAIASVLLLAPFAIVNVLQDRPIIGLAPLAALLLLIAVTRQFRLRIERPAISLLLMTLAMVVSLSITLHAQGIAALFWCFPILLAYYCMFDERNALFANAVTLVTIIPQAWLLLEPEITLRASATLIAVSIFLAISARMTGAYHESLKTQAITDPLTGLFNRNILGVTLERAVEQFQRVGTPMVVLLIDLDHFKSINDNFGHASGDTVLARIGPLIEGSTRMSDTCFRIGGEEFLCLLYGSDLQNGVRVAERMREAIQTTNILPDRQITASIGVTDLREEVTADEWNARADKLVYKAKHLGRNRVCGG